MKIEHWVPRNSPPDARPENTDHQFLWSNLLGVCLGGSSESSDPRASRNTTHCDTSRGNADLFLHPVEGQGPDPGEYLRYNKGGSVEAARSDARVEGDIRVLNLNAWRLVRARQEVFDAAWKRLEGAGFATGELRRLERELRIVAGIKVREHAEFLRYHVRKKLRRLGEVA